MPDPRGPDRRPKKSPRRALSRWGGRRGRRARAARSSRAGVRVRRGRGLKNFVCVDATRALDVVYAEVAALVLILRAHV